MTHDTNIVTFYFKIIVCRRVLGHIYTRCILVKINIQYRSVLMSVRYPGAKVNCTYDIKMVLIHRALPETFTVKTQNL